MAKIIKYKMTANGFTKELYCRTESDFDENLPIAQEEALNGEYTIDGEFDTTAERTQEERIAELEEALEMLLDGVTE